MILISVFVLSFSSCIALGYEKIPDLVLTGLGDDSPVYIQRSFLLQSEIDVSGSEPFTVRIPRRVSVAEDGILRITYTSDVELRLSLAGGQSQLDDLVLPFRGHDFVTLEIPLQQGFELFSFQFESGLSGKLQLHSMEYLRDSAVFLQKKSPAGNEVYVPSYMQYSAADEGRGHLLRLTPDFDRSFSFDSQKEYLYLKVRVGGEVPPGKGSFSRIAENHPADLGPETGFVERISYSNDHREFFFRLEDINEELLLLGLDYQEFSVEPVIRSVEEPIPADFGQILASSVVSLQDRDFLLYQWCHLPQVLVMDFADYQLQARYLKRLAFFVEKEGFKGILHSNEVIEPLHGWNAHDYKADDLAAFFQLAKEELFVLNPEEYQLRNMLLNQGIILKRNGAYVPGSGSVISISRESSAGLRHRFIAHEGYHGIFFTNEVFRQEMTGLWRNLSEIEQELWKQFLYWKGRYDTTNEYLMVNEFMAYLLQQPVNEDMELYYWKHNFPRLRQAYPETGELIDGVFRNHPDSFTKNALAVEEVLYRLTGNRAGGLMYVQVNELSSD